MHICTLEWGYITSAAPAPFPTHLLLLCVRALLRQVTVLPSTMVALDAYTDNPGTWLFHCHLNDHMHGGMMALFTVTGTAPTHTLNGKVCWCGVTG